MIEEPLASDYFNRQSIVNMIKDSTRDDLLQEITTTPGFIPPPEMT